VESDSEDNSDLIKQGLLHMQQLLGCLEPSERMGLPLFSQRFLTDKLYLSPPKSFWTKSDKEGNEHRSGHFLPNHSYRVTIQS